MKEIINLIILLIGFSSGFVIDNENTKCVLNGRDIPKKHPLSCTEGPSFHQSNPVIFNETKEHLLQVAFPESDYKFLFENYCIDREDGKNVAKLCDSIAFVKICCIFTGRDERKCFDKDLDFDFSSKIVDGNQFLVVAPKIQPVFCDLGFRGKQFRIRELEVEDNFFIFQNGSLKIFEESYANEWEIYNDYCLEVGGSKILAFIYETQENLAEKIIKNYSKFLMPTLFVLVQFVFMLVLLIIGYFYWERIRSKEKMIPLLH
jgi:hypothetical protein